MENEHTHHASDTPSREETLALLTYMAHHNAHHAEELEQTLPTLPVDAGQLIREAVALLSASAEKINEALKALGE